jgi:hypothetical protein
MLQSLIKTKQWTKVAFGGWLLGVVLLILLSSILEASGIENMQFYIGISMGAGVGFAQWRLLKKYMAMSIHWFCFSVIGIGLPFLLFDFVMDNNTAIKLPLSVAIGGILAGVLQFRFLKGYVTNASIWIYASALGWTLAALTTLLINYTMQFKVTGYMNLVLALLNLGLILAGGLVLGWSTAWVIKRIKA